MKSKKSSKGKSKNINLSSSSKNISKNFKGKDKPKPFLKWAGGKKQLLDDIELRLPEHIKKTKTIDQYIEPFIVSKKFENKDYSVGDIIVESNRYDY